MSATDVPALAGIHHLKLPVTDLAQSPGQITTIHDARETAERREEAERAQRATAIRP